MKERLALGLALATTAAAPAVAEAAPSERDSLHQTDANTLVLDANPSPIGFTAEGPVANAAATFQWENIGGDPVVQGGIDTKREFRSFIRSPKGTRTMRRIGLDAQERSAFRKEVKNLRNIENCTFEYGERVQRMAFDEGRRSERNAVHSDEQQRSVPAFCVDFEVPVGKDKTKTVETITPLKCVNVSIVGEEVRKRIQKRKTAPVRVFKHALNEHGQLLSPTPTGTFRMMGECIQKGRKIKRVVTYFRANQVLMNCDVKLKNGKRQVVKVSELSTLGTDQWKHLTPAEQKQKMTSKGAKFVFKNQQVGVDNRITKVTVEKVCPPSTNWVDKNGNGKVDDNECETPPPPPEQGKDPRPGAGSTTPGQPGGSGAGGEAEPGAQPGDEEFCRDTNDTANGDQNPQTEGDLMIGQADQFGYCDGPAQPREPSRSEAFRSL